MRKLLWVSVEWLLCLNQFFLFFFAVKSSTVMPFRREAERMHERMDGGMIRRGKNKHEQSKE